MIIHDPKIIFIHIPKTGGTTIENLLESNRKVGTPYRRFGAHHTLQQVYKKLALPDEKDEDFKPINMAEYYIFTVARNPWARYASIYVHDLKAHAELKHRKRLPPIEEYMQHSIAENFFSFIEVNGQIPDNLMMINFDDFQAEIDRVFDTMGLRAPKRLPHANKKIKKYKVMESEIIANTAFQEAVATMCEKEIALFGYDIPLDNR
jgi:hypothetical protein